LSRSDRLVLAAILGVGLLLAWRARFVLDDAFISFQYARSLVEGAGLTWFGVRVEGYSNFGWVCWLALGMALGFEPVAWSQASGLAAFCAATVLLWRVVWVATDGATPAVVVALVGFVTNFSVHSFATGGLATMLQTALLLATFHAIQLARREDSVRLGTLLVASFCAAGALLARLDSAVALAPIGCWALLGVVVGGATERRGSRFLALGGPVTLVVGCWFVWKLAYYGSVLPNSFAAKVTGVDGLSDGLLQWWRFFVWYSLLPVVGALAGGLLFVRARLAVAAREASWVALAILSANLVYLGAVGGDFMEFRFLVPVAPFAYLLVGLLFEGLCRSASVVFRRVLAVQVAALFAISSAVHATTYYTDPDLRMDGIDQLGDFYGLYPDASWDRIGSALARELGEVNPRLAVTAAGAIPFYSRFESVDLWGLNDPVIPTLGLVDSYRRPGHRFRAPFDYLEERGVNLIVGSPTVVPWERLRDSEVRADWLRGWAALATPVQDSGPRWLDVVAMPLDAENALLLWVLKTTPALESAMAGWMRWTVPYHPPKRSRASAPD